MYTATLNTFHCLDTDHSKSWVDEYGSLPPAYEMSPDVLIDICKLFRPSRLRMWWKVPPDTVKRYGRNKTVSGYY